MKQWIEYCLKCKQYNGDAGICMKLNFNIRDYPKRFASTCNGEFYKNDPIKKNYKTVVETKPEEEPNSGLRRTKYRSPEDYRRNAMKLFIPESGCMLCRSETQLNSARFYYGQYGMSRETVILVRETKRQWMVEGHKSFSFCNNCLNIIVIAKRKIMQKHIIVWLGGTLLWLIIWIASAFTEVPILFGGIFIAGIVLAIRFVPKMFKNSSSLKALRKKRGAEKFEDFLDEEAVRVFLRDSNKVNFPTYTYWTRSQYKIIKESNSN